MTDQELAIQLGNYINRQLTRIAALESALMAHEIPDWREDAERIAQEPASLAVSAAHSHHIQYSISGDTPESALIRSLHRLYVEP
jgi:hypothetical protein